MTLTLNLGLVKTERWLRWRFVLVINSESGQALCVETFRCVGQTASQSINTNDVSIQGVRKTACREEMVRQLAREINLPIVGLLSPDQLTSVLTLSVLIDRMSWPALFARTPMISE